MPSRTLPDYTTGTITVTNASRTVTGSGTGWTTTLNGVTESTVAAGDMLIVSTGRPVMIESVDSATQITLTENWPNSTASGTAYKIRRYVALPTGSVLAALQSVEARGTDSNALTSFTVDGGTTRVKLRQASGGQGALSVGSTGAADGSLVDAILMSSTALVGIRGVPSEELDVIRSQNATTTARVYNSNTGASSAAEFIAQTGTANSSLSMAAFDNAADPYARIRAGSAATVLYNDAAAHTWRNAAGSTEYARLDSSGKVIIGYSSPFSSGLSATAQFSVGNIGSTSGSGISISKFRNSSGVGADLELIKSRVSVIAGNTIGSSGDLIGTITWTHADGTGYVPAASISASIDGTPGTNDMPGRLVFSTTADGAASVTERMRIDSAGRVGIGTTSLSGYSLRVARTSDATNYNGVAVTGFDDASVTSAAFKFSSTLQTSSNSGTPYTIPTVYHYYAVQGTLNADSTVTTQYGFFAQNNLTGAISNYGFVGNIPGATTLTVSNVERASNIVTITTSTAHGLKTGSSVFVQATTNTSVNGTFTVVEALTTTTFTYAQTGADITSGADTGSVYPKSRYNTYNVGTAENYFAGKVRLGGTPGAHNLDTAAVLVASGTSATTSNAAFVRYTNDAFGPTIYLAKSRSASNGINAAISSGDSVGVLDFRANDGTGFYQVATVTGAADAASSAGSTAGRLVFSTTASGASTVSERMRIDSSGNVLVTGAGGLGYGTGSGGAVTQGTSRTTGVTLDKTNGAITLFSAAGSATWQSFTVTNNKVAATDTVVVCQKSGTDLYQIMVTNVAAGSFKISFATTGGTTTEQPVFNFAVIKAVAA